MDVGIEKPEIGIVLGTGLGGIVNMIDIEKKLPYHDIPNFPVSTVVGHSGTLIYGRTVRERRLLLCKEGFIIMKVGKCQKLPFLFV